MMCLLFIHLLFERYRSPHVYHGSTLFGTAGRRSILVRDREHGTMCLMRSKETIIFLLMRKICIEYAFRNSLRNFLNIDEIIVPFILVDKNSGKTIVMSR
jgi:hypothetical protein